LALSRLKGEISSSDSPERLGDYVEAASIWEEQLSDGSSEFSGSPKLTRMISNIRETILLKNPLILLQGVQYDNTPEDIERLNKLDQFDRDHQIAENLPLYVENLSNSREKEDSVLDALSTVAEGNEQFTDKIQTYATQSLFNITLTNNEEFFKVVEEMGQKFPNTIFCFSSVGESAQFLQVDNEKKEAVLTGLAQVKLQSQSEKGDLITLGSFSLQTKMRITPKEASSATTTFPPDSYEELFKSQMEGGNWGLL